MLRLEALRVFVTVADSGNIKDAAERVGRTPSAVSMTLKQIEERLGAPLFETDRKHRLTDLGRFVHKAAVVLLRDYERAVDLIEAYAQNRTGRLRLASVPSVATVLLPPVLGDFVAARPGVAIELIDTDSVGVRTLVENGQVDFGIGGAPPASAGLAFRPLFSDPFRLVCQAHSALVSCKGPLSWHTLESTEMIVNESARALASPAFQALAGRASLTVRNVASLLAMVQSGMGVTLLPALATASMPDTLRALALADPAAIRTVGLVARQGRVASPMAAAFQEALIAAVGQRAASLGLTLPSEPRRRTARLRRRGGKKIAGSEDPAS